MSDIIPLWAFPAAATVIALWAIAAPYRPSGLGDCGGAFRWLLLVPVLIVWAIYFAMCAARGGFQ